MEKIKFVALGGMDEEGKSCYCIEIENEIYIVEAGLKHPSMAMTGVESIYPNFQYLEQNSSKIKAIFITHAHDDVYGSLSKLINIAKCPIYTTEFTSMIIKQDYHEKLRSEFPGNIVVINPNSSIKVNSREINFFSTTHNVPFSFGLSISTDQGNIVYTSDMVNDFDSMELFKSNFQRLIEVANKKKNFLLLTDSTCANLSGVASPKHKITPLIEHKFDENEGKIFIALYQSNLYNIVEVINLCLEKKKRLCVLNKQLRKQIDYFVEKGFIRLPSNFYINQDDIEHENSKNIVILISAIADSVFDMIRDVCHEKYKNIYVNKNDLFIMAVPSLPQTEIQHTEIVDIIYETDSHVILLSRKQISSMHAQEEELKMLLTLFKPEFYIPVKGEYRKLYASAQIAFNMNIGLNHMNILLLDNGDLIQFDENGKLSPKASKINTNEVVIEDENSHEVNASILRERAVMGEDGVIIASFVVSLKLRKLLSSLDLQMRGCIFLKEQESLVNEVQELLLATIKETLKTAKRIEDIENACADVIRKTMRKKVNKEPVISIIPVNYEKEIAIYTKQKIAN